MSGQCKQLSDTNLTAHLTATTQPALVGFMADWCGTCHILGPMLRRLARCYAGSLQAYVLDVENFPTTKALYRIYQLPTLLLFEKGALVDQYVGLVTEKELTNRLDQLVKASQEQ